MTFEGIAGAIVSTLLLAALIRTVRLTARKSGSRFVLEYGKPMRALGVVSLLLGALFILVGSHSSPDQRAIAWVVCGSLAGCTVYIFLEVFMVRLEFDETFIYHFSPWRRDRQIPWSEIISVSFSQTNRWYVIRTQGHGTLRVSTFLSGIGSFVERLEKTLKMNIDP